MIKVKQWMDKYLFPADTNVSAELKKNGHYEVHGWWEYPKGICESEDTRIRKLMKTDPQLKTWIPKDQMSFLINNETMVIRMCIVNGKNVAKYGYLQTYEHIPRTGPDEYGYYSRSTDEEIIRYLTEIYEKINKNVIREEKLKRILEL